MTPTREQLRAVREAAISAQHVIVELNFAGKADSATVFASDMASAWRFYVDLGDWLGRTGTEPPQPAEKR